MAFDMMHIAKLYQEILDAPLTDTPAIKHDTEKNRIELFPLDVLEDISQVLTFGSKKYDCHNWKKGFKWSRLLGATLRHLAAWSRGIDKDPETGFSHLAHAGCCIVFLIWHEKFKKELDDRSKDPEIIQDNNKQEK